MVVLMGHTHARARNQIDHAPVQHGEGGADEQAQGHNHIASHQPVHFLCQRPCHAFRIEALYHGAASAISANRIQKHGALVGHDCGWS